jgi:hypothetical protein
MNLSRHCPVRKTRKLVDENIPNKKFGNKSEYTSAKTNGDQEKT